MKGSQARISVWDLLCDYWSARKMKKLCWNVVKNAQCRGILGFWSTPSLSECRCNIFREESACVNAKLWPDWLVTSVCSFDPYPTPQSSASNKKRLQSQHRMLTLRDFRETYHLMSHLAFDRSTARNDISMLVIITVIQSSVRSGPLLD